MFSLKYETCGLIGCKGVIEWNMLLSQAPMVGVVKQVFCVSPPSFGGS